MRAAVIPLAFAVLLMASCQSVPDSVMLQSFTQRKAALDELAHMALQDRLSCPIPASGEADCVSQTRLAQYQALLKSARVFAVSPQWDRSCILFPSIQESALLAIHTHARGYAYATNNPLLPSTKDTRGELGENVMAFRQINGSWYLYFSA